MLNIKKSQFAQRSLFRKRLRSFSQSNSDVTGPSGRLSLDKFFSTQKDPQYQLSDDNALKYMKMAADLSLIRFKDEQEMLQYKNDFQSALMFIKKLEEVDVKGVEPLANVLEYYGGNDSKMRSYEELEKIDQEAKNNPIDIQKEISQMNSNMQSSLVKTPRPFK